jgi:spore germination protein YaaH/flagellar hook assembly protein FlgD
MAVLVAAPAAAGDPATIVAGGTGGNGGFVPPATAGSAVAGFRDAPPAVGGVPGPSVAYQETIAHAGSDYDFTPGAPVSVPLRPRLADPAAAPAARTSAGSSVASGSSGTGGAPAASTPPRAGAGSVGAAGVGTLRREVYGFLPYWELVDPDRRLDYASLSTIAYFSSAASADGSLVTTDPDGTATSGWGGWTSQAMTDVIDAAHAAGVRVDFTVTLFAWTSTQRRTQSALLGSATARSRLVSTLVSTVVGRGADGVNLDVEPLVAGYEDELVALVRELRVALDAAGPGRRITVDVLGSPENYPHEDLVAPGAADAIFIMGYDYRGSGAAYAGSISPLTGAGYDLTETVARYTARVPASKVILGIPYYGRAWSTVSDALRAKTQSSATYGSSATASYALAASLSEENGRRWDDEEQVPWTAYRRTVCDTCTETWRQLYYDDVESLRRKYTLADANGLAGVGIWALGYDGTRPELAALLREVFGGAPTDTTPPRAALAVLPPDAPDEGIVVSWGATDAGGIAAYDVQVSTGGGPWTDWLVATTATTDVWLGRTGAGYAFRARATDPAGNVSRWTTEDARTGATTLAKGGFVRVVASSLPLRVTASTTAKKVATVRTGDVLLVTAGPKASGGVTWVQVSGPLTQWPIVSPVRTKAWMAVKQGKTVLAAATLRPSATVVAAGFSGLTFDGAGGASLGAAGAAHRAFSPGTDGSRDRLALTWRSRVAMTGVSARIVRTDGSLVGAVAIGSMKAGTRTWAWDGKVAGAVVPDGAYLVQLLGRGGATTYRSPSARPATPAQIDRFAVTVDTVPPILGSATISGTTLAPDAPGGAASVAVAGSAPDAASWSVVVARVSATAGAVSAGTAARTLSGSGPSASAAWDGTNDAGRRLPRGTYRVTLSMADAAGNVATTSWTVELQTAGPQLAASVDPAAIAPDGDGVADRATIRWTTDVPVTGAIRVLRGTATVRAWPVASATSGTVRWDGTDAKGRAVAEGRYTVLVDVASAAGDPAAVEAAIAVDRTVRSFTATPPRFAPADGDALAPTTRITYTLARPATTRLAIVDTGGAEVRVVWDGKAQPVGQVGWTWDGRIGGVYAADGVYTLALRATSGAGTIELRRTVPLGAFEIRLSAPTLAPGEALTVTATAAEPLRAAPSITLTQAGLPAVKKIAAAAGAGRWTATFTVAAGGAGTATITVAGRDAAGRVEVGRATVTVG